MKLNKKLEFGIKAITFLRSSEGPVSITDMASEVGTTTNFLFQIMRDLRNAGIITTKRGPGGGYILNRDATITAYCVATAVGRDFSAPTLGETPTNRLAKALTEAFLNTTV